MDKQEAKKRIKKLHQEINHHRYLYHVLDRPEISDAALDSLKHELAELEEKFPDLITPDSPTQRVGGKPLDKFVKVRHSKAMLSLQDAFSAEEMKAWEERVAKLVPGQKLDYFVELKLDGFAIELIYENGILKTGATRGDGVTGEDVTSNLKTIEAIPLRLEKLDKGRIEVRGEVFMSKKAFARVNKEQKKKGLAVYANPRNLAAGSIRQLDPKLAASRDLDFMAYEMVTDKGLKTHQEKHELLKKRGFKVNKFNKYCKNLEAVIKFHQQWIAKRDKLDYQIDGLVVVVNSLKLEDRLGTVGKAPRWAIALKFPGAEATTRVEDIQVQVGRTGALTPVAHLKPVQIGGTTVRRATLHNMDEIKRLGVKIGDTVILQRAGDVIPDIVKVLPKLRTGKEKEFRMPHKCPVCSSKITRKSGEVAYYCSNKNCYAVSRRQLNHFVSRKAFNIEGLGDKILVQLVKADLVKDAADLYKLSPEDLKPLERFADKSADNLVEAIKDSKKIPLAKFIYALGIKHVGEETAIDLANKFGSLEKLEKVSLEKLENVADIGPVVAKSIYEFFQDKKNLEYIAKLEKAGIETEKPKIKKSQKLANKKMVITGSLESISREEAKEKIRLAGGDWVSSVSKNTDYVVVGEEPGSKYDQAKKLGVKIIDEKEFSELLK
jgi:DNA ligase (NAD+)